MDVNDPDGPASASSSTDDADLVIARRWRVAAAASVLLLLVPGVLYAAKHADRATGIDLVMVLAYVFGLAVLTTVLARVWLIDRARIRSVRLLRASEERYRTMVSALDAGVLIFDGHGRVQGGNPAAERMLRRSISQMQENNLADWVTIDENELPIPTEKLPVAIALSKGVSSRDVLVGNVDRSGNIAWINVSVEPLQDGTSDQRRGAVVSFSDVTERRRVAAALVASEATNRALMNSLADGVFVAQEYRFVYANTALPAMLGYGPEEFVDVPFDQVLAPDMLPIWNERFTRRVGTGAEPARSYEVRFLTKDKSREIELELVATRATYNSRPAVIGLVRDITERRKTTVELERHRHHLEELVEERTRELRAALEAQAESENFAQIITDNQPTLLAYIDPQMKLLFANRSYIAWYGKTREEMLGKSVVDVLGAELLGEHVMKGCAAIVDRVLRGEAVEAAMDMPGAGGVVGHFLTYRLPDVRNGRMRGYFFIGINVTELRAAQRRLEELNVALKAAADFTRLIADNIPGGIAYWDTELRCRFVNMGYAAWFGMTPEALIGRTTAEMVGEERAAAGRDRTLAALRGEAQRFEREEVSADGRVITTLIHYVPDFHNGEVKGFFVLALDVTQTHHARHALELLNQDLVRERDRAEAAARAKSAFLANMSHEIRTPMNAIIGLTHLIRRDNPPARIGERLGRVGDAAQHLLEIINNVLDLSKIEAGKLELEVSDFSLQTLVDRACALVAEQAREKGLALTSDIGGLPVEVHGDAPRLSQALVNLLANAVKFTEHGSVAVVGRTIETDGADCMLRFEVRDTGIGIASNQIEQIFTAFEQADGSTTRRFGGTGLGLGITRHLARLMGGDAGASSEPGVGSTFWITVRMGLSQAPEHLGRTLGEGTRSMVPDDMPEAAKASSMPMGLDMLAEDSLRAAHQGARILLAEDNPVNQEVAIVLLQLAGMTVELAQTGREAVAMATSRHYDLILMDMQMPELDGLQAARVLRTQPGTARTPIIAMTANAYADDRAACLAAGMNDFVTKPVDPPMLYDVLAQWLAKTRPASPSGDGSTLVAPGPIEGTPGLNVARGMAFFAGNRDVYLRALRQFVGLYEVGVPVASDWIANPSAESVELLRRELHSFGGASSAVGADALGEQASALGGRLRELATDERLGDVDDIEPALSRMLGDLAELVRAVKLRLPSDQ